MTDDLNIQWLIRRDLDEVLAIEADVSPDPWDEETMLRWLRIRNTIGMVAKRGEDVVGYMIYELHKGHLVLLRFAVRRDVQRKRIGTALIDRLKAKLSQQRRREIEALVDDGNLPMQLFLCSHRFRATIEDEDTLRFVYDVRTVPLDDRTEFEIAHRADVVRHGREARKDKETR